MAQEHGQGHDTNHVSEVGAWSFRNMARSRVCGHAQICRLLRHAFPILRPTTSLNFIPIMVILRHSSICGLESHRKLMAKRRIPRWGVVWLMFFILCKCVANILISQTRDLQRDLQLCAKSLGSHQISDLASKAWKFSTVCSLERPCIVGRQPKIPNSLFVSVWIWFVFQPCSTARTTTSALQRRFSVRLMTL